MSWVVINSFCLAVIISFVGSVQLGPVNMGTIHTALKQDKKSAIMFGLGGSIPELFYSSLAFGSANLLSHVKGLENYLNYLTIAVLLTFGVYLILQKRKKIEQQENFKKRGALAKGAAIGFLNPQLYPFWLFVIANIRTNGYLTLAEPATEVAFVLGTAVGAFILQYLVAEVTYRKREFFFVKFTKNYSQVLGSILIVIAIFQLTTELQ